MAQGKRHYCLALPIDAAVPFLPWTVFIYFFACLIFWFFLYRRVAALPRRTADRFFCANLLGKAISFFFFVFFPTTMTQPEPLLYGAAFAGASVIWEREEWSLTKMTLTHLLVCSLATFPIAYCMYWMEHSVSGVLLYFGVFLMIYAAIWLGQYSSIKRKLDAINRKMSEKNF